MREYIERAAVLNKTQEIYHWAGYESRYDEFVSCEDIRNIPAADVVEVRHGRWVVYGDGVFCSNCGTALKKGKIEPIGFHFCPNYGARMNKED